MLKYEVVPGIKPSFAERRLAEKLNEVDIVYAQEVVFEDCKNPVTGLHLRFDFYLPVQNILIEYDGVDFHATPEIKLRDKIKNKFAKENKIKLIRIQGISNIDKWVYNKFGTPTEKKITKVDPIQKRLEDHNRARAKRNKISVEQKKIRRENVPQKPKKSQSEMRELIRRKTWT